MSCKVQGARCGREVMFNEKVLRMKHVIIVLVLAAISLRLAAQADTQVYDSVLARKLGADDYGMKTYVLVILKAGPNKIEAGPQRDKLFSGHMANINKLADEGKLVIAGPMAEENEKTYEGIFILNVKTIKEATELLKGDPTIKEKVLDTELFLWYGSAAISEYLKVAKSIEKKHF